MKNIIIPLGGLGIRFQEAHYTCPKPLVKVQGKSIIEWVLESIDIKEVIGIYISYHASLAPYHFDSFLQKKFPNYPIHCYCLNQNTKGAADTVFQTLSHFESLNEIDLDLPIISLDGDNFYTINIMELWKGKNNVFIFKDYQQNPIYSYISLKRDDTQENINSIACIKEKEKISNMACTGAYAFKSGNLFIEYCRKVLQEPIATNKEYYISVVIQSMLDNTIEFEMLEIFSKNPIKKCDIIIVEGYKNEDIPKLEVYRPIIKKPLLFTEDKNIFAIASDVKIESSIPTFDLNNINTITDYIIQKYKIS